MNDKQMEKAPANMRASAFDNVISQMAQLSIVSVTFPPFLLLISHLLSACTLPLSCLGLWKFLEHCSVGENLMNLRD
jgi:hypothetical protein